MNLDKAHNVFVNSDKFFLSISTVLPVTWTSSINAFTLILAHTWLYNYVKNLQGVKEYLKILIKKEKEFTFPFLSH